MILVDSNVIIDVLSQDASWLAWTEAASSDAADGDEIAINPIIYAEIASGFATMAALDAREPGRTRSIARYHATQFHAGLGSDVPPLRCGRDTLGSRTLFDFYGDVPSGSEASPRVPMRSAPDARPAGGRAASGICVRLRRSGAR